MKHLKLFNISSYQGNETKTALRFHLTLFKRAKMNKTSDSRCFQVYEERAPLTHCWWECKLTQLPWKSVCKFLKLLKIYLKSQLYQSWAHTQRLFFVIQRFLFIHVCCCSISNSQKLETACLSIDWWLVPKVWYIYTMWYYSALKKN